MEQLRIPAGYHSPLTIRETEVAIKEVKRPLRACSSKESPPDTSVSTTVCPSRIWSE